MVSDDLEKQEKRTQELESKIYSHFYQRYERFKKIKDESTNHSQHFDELELQMYRPISKRWVCEKSIPMSPMMLLPRLGEGLLSHLNDNRNNSDQKNRYRRPATAAAAAAAATFSVPTTLTAPLIMPQLSMSQLLPPPSQTPSLKNHQSRLDESRPTLCLHF